MNSEVISRLVSFLESWLQFRYERLELPGFAVGISIGDNIVFKKAYGYANMETKEQLTTNHIFRVASQSKTFTSTAIMQLAENGRLGIDDAVIDHLPWLCHHNDPRIKNVTLRQLMSHSAGLIRDGADADYWQMMSPFPDQRVLIDEVLAAELIIENNKQMKYSNVGYALLGLVVEASTGKPYNEYINEHLIQPLRLTNTGPEFNNTIVDRLVTGYSRPEQNRQRTPLRSTVDTKSMAAATGVYSTVEDLCKYFSAHFVKTGKLISDESKKEMQRTQWPVTNTKLNEEYGLGFAIEQSGKRRMFGHGGGFPGQSTASFCNSDLQTVIVVLTNCIDGDAGLIVKGILGIIDHFERGYENASSKTFDNFKQFEGRFLNLWGIREIVQSGDRLVAIFPNTWQPFSDSSLIEELEIIDSQTLRIAKTVGFGSEGELVRYNFQENGNVKSLQYAGMTMWTEERYLDSYAPPLLVP